MARDVNFTKIAESLDGYTGSDIKEVRAVQYMIVITTLLNIRFPLPLFFFFCLLLSAVFYPIASLFYSLLYTPAYRLHFFPLLPLIPCILFNTKGL